MIQGVEFMGDNVRNRLGFCGTDVRLYPLCKIIRGENAKLDNNCQIFDFVWIDAGAGLTIGKFSTLHWYVLIEGSGTTTIGDRVFIGPGSKILTSTDQINGFYTVSHLPDGCQETKRSDIIIEDDSYIGANCALLPGTRVGEGAVVGANSLVTKDLEPWGIYVGSPCRRVGTREKPTEERRNLLARVNWENHL